MPEQFDDVNISVSTDQKALDDYSDGGGSNKYHRYGVVDSRDPREKIRELCGDLLPRVAVEQEWPIVFDHCFYRVAYDCGCGEQWTEKYDGSPGYKVLGKWEAKRAASFAEIMLHGGRYSVKWNNVRSLFYRDELGCYPHECPVMCYECGYSDNGVEGEIERDGIMTRECPDCGGWLTPDYDALGIHHQYR